MTLQQSIQIPIRWKLKDAQDVKQEFTDYLKNSNKLKPVRFGYSVDYAESLEYGTGPLKNMQIIVNGGNYTYESIWEDINEWARKKLKMENKEHRENFVTGVVNRMWDFGLYAHPFWRPAINWLLENQQRMFDEGHSLKEIADEALRVSNKCIMDQNLPYEGNLQKSAFIEDIDWREVKDGKDFKEYNDDERNRLFKEVGWI